MSWIYSLQTGDELISAKSKFSAIKHHAVVIRYAHSPVPYVIDNAPETGVQLQLLTEYLKENNILRVNKFLGNADEKRMIYKRVKQALGKSYDTFKFNCEHLANFYASELEKADNSTSTSQVFAFLAAATIGIILWVRNRKQINTRSTS